MAIKRSTVEFIMDGEGKPLLSVDTGDAEQPFTLRVARVNQQQLADLYEAIGSVLQGVRGGVSAPKGIGTVPKTPAETR